MLVAVITPHMLIGLKQKPKRAVSAREFWLVSFLSSPTIGRLQDEKLNVLFQCNYSPYTVLKSSD